MKTILVVGRDWKFRALLRAQLREEGFNALGFETMPGAEPETAGAAALLFDTTGAQPADWPVLQRLAAQLPVIVVAGTTEEVAVAGAKLLRRPVSLGDIVAVVRELASDGP